MKTTAFVIFTLISILLISCKKDEIYIDGNNPLLGTWNVSGYEDNNTTVYDRSTAFVDQYGYEFRTDGTVIERKNAGWCGTPPITYADYTGTWKYINDTLVQIEIGYWGGMTTYQLDIESVDAEHLKAIYVYLGE